MTDVYDAAYTTIRTGAPGLSDATCEVIAQSIARKLKATAVSPAAAQDEHELIERLLDAQQDINLAANETMRQSLADASALIDEIEPILRQALNAHSSAAQDASLRIAVLKLESIRMMRSDRAGGPYPKSYKGGFDAAADLMSGWAEEALAALKAEAAGHG